MGSAGAWTFRCAGDGMGAAQMGLGKDIGEPFPTESVITWKDDLRDAATGPEQLGRPFRRRGLLPLSVTVEN